MRLEEFAKKLHENKGVFRDKYKKVIDIYICTKMISKDGFEKTTDREVRKLKEEDFVKEARFPIWLISPKPMEFSMEPILTPEEVRSYKREFYPDIDQGWAFVGDGSVRVYLFYKEV